MWLWRLASQNLQGEPAGWRPEKANTAVPVQNWSKAGDPGKTEYSFKYEDSLLKKQEELMLQGKFEGKLLEKSLAQGGQLFCSIQTFNLLNIAHPHSMKNNQLYSKSMDLRVNITPKYSHRITQNILHLAEYQHSMA